MAARQIALPLGPAGPVAPSRIIIGHANEAAVEALGVAENWPFRTAILLGPPRSGKSLLAGWFAASGLGDALDDAHLLDETALFHRWNRAQEEGRPLLLTAPLIAGAAPWRVALPDLASRLGAALTLEIGLPDEVMLAELIAAHAEARGLALSEEGCRYLANRAERSHIAAEHLVALVDRISLERKQAPGAAIWRAALEEMQGPPQPRLL